MLLIINLTGLSKTYWIPKFHYRKDGEIWFIEIKFLFIQVSLYSKYMGDMFGRIINDWSKTNIKEHNNV